MPANTLLDRATEPESADKTYRQNANSNTEELLRHRLRPLYRTRDHRPRFTKETLRNDWGIHVERLDLCSGKAAEQEAFIRPIPADTILSWLNELRPWECDERRREPCMNFDLFECHPSDTNYGSDIKNSATVIEAVARNHLTHTIDFKKGYMIDKTNWRRCSHEVRLRSYVPYTHDWEVGTMFHQCHPDDADVIFLSEVRANSALPHISCFLHDNETLVDDGSLSTPELLTVMLCAVRQMLRYPSAVVLPVTVYSCADRHVRVVQGCIDFGNKVFNVRCSELIDFTVGVVSGNEERMKPLITLLGWILGDPVGDVNKKQ